MNGRFQKVVVAGGAFILISSWIWSGGRQWIRVFPKRCIQNVLFFLEGGTFHAKNWDDRCLSWQFLIPFCLLTFDSFCFFWCTSSKIFLHLPLCISRSEISYCVSFFISLSWINQCLCCCMSWNWNLPGWPQIFLIWLSVGLNRTQASSNSTVCFRKSRQRTTSSCLLIHTRVRHSSKYQKHPKTGCCNFLHNVMFQTMCGRYRFPMLKKSS